MSDHDQAPGPERLDAPPTPVPAEPEPPGEDIKKKSSSFVGSLASDILQALVVVSVIVLAIGGVGFVAGYIVAVAAHSVWIGILAGILNVISVTGALYITHFH